MANESQHIVLVAFLLRLGVIATIAAVLVRSMAFKRYLYREERNLREKLIFVLFLVIPLGGDVVMRLLAPGFGLADLSLPGSILIGLMAGQTAGLVGGFLIGVPGAIVAHQWLGLVLAMLAGWAGGLCRRAAPSTEEIWAFSPFIDLELWRWLQNRLDRPLRDWQALMFGVLVALTLVQWDLARMFPTQVFAWRLRTGWEVLGAILATILAVAIPIKIWNNTRIEMKLEEQQRLLMQARLEALTSQINPHFLFNTLNSVASLVRFDPDTARLLIIKLSNILRRLLKKHENYAELQEELGFVGDYLDIEIVRFGPERLRFVKEVEPGVLHDPIPSMLLQPFIENSIRHGLASSVKGGQIIFRARREATDGGGRRGAHLVLEIEDNGAGMSRERLAEARQCGIGISNAQERLRVLYGDAASLQIRSQLGRGTWIQIAVPVGASAAEGEPARETAPPRAAAP